MESSQEHDGEAVPVVGGRVPPRLVDVPFEMNWWSLLAWGFALVIVAAVLCGGLAFATFALVKALDLSRFGVVVLLVVGNATLFGCIAIVWYYDRRRKIRRFIAETTPEKLPAAVFALLHWRKLDLFATDAAMFTKYLARAGVFDVVVRVARPRSLTAIEPFTHVFEPQPIDEAHPTFRDLTATSDAADESMTGSDREMTRRLKRNVTLNGGWVALSIFSVFFVVYLIDSLRKGQPQPMLYFWGGMLLMFVIAPGARLVSTGRQWLAVPGGIVLRKARWRGGWRLHRLTSERSFMLVTRAPFQEIWFATISDGLVTTRLQFTRDEMAFVLRCWLSPLEPPPLDRLGELQGEG
ncbi:MAG: hypothetical protein ACKVS9_00620 [Phycisphaerae bacterium]